MAFTPRIAATVQITCKDINGNSIAKTYNNVLQVNIDMAKGMIGIVDDVLGAPNFQFTPATTVTYTCNTNASPAVHAIVIS